MQIQHDVIPNMLIESTEKNILKQTILQMQAKPNREFINNRYTCDFQLQCDERKCVSPRRTGPSRPLHRNVFVVYLSIVFLQIYSIRLGDSLSLAFYKQHRLGCSLADVDGDLTALFVFGACIHVYTHRERLSVFVRDGTSRIFTIILFYRNSTHNICSGHERVIFTHALFLNARILCISAYRLRTYVFFSKNTPWLSIIAC